MKLPLHNALRLIKRAQEEETKEYFFRIYLVQLPNMDEKTYKSFNQFYDDIKPKNIEIDTRSKDDIMNEILGRG